MQFGLFVITSSKFYIQTSDQSELDASREASRNTPSDYFQREWIAPPWRERRQQEDMKSSGFSGENIDFQLDALPNAYVSYCSRLMRFAKDCSEPILMYPGSTRGNV